MDFIDATVAAVTAAGFDDATPSLAAVGSARECVAVVGGAAQQPQRYYDGSFSAQLEARIYVKRTAQLDAELGAWRIYNHLNDSPPYSIDGSYSLGGYEVTPPDAVMWDGAGYYIETVVLRAQVSGMEQ